MSLRPCLSCTRHVRSSEMACPFCGSSLPAAPALMPRSVAGLGRAAIMAFGAVAVATEVGCNVAPAYGLPPVDSGADATFIGSDDARNGGPPDAAISEDDAAASPDANNDAGAQLDSGGGIGPLYGGAP